MCLCIYLENWKRRNISAFRAYTIYHQRISIGPITHASPLIPGTSICRTHTIYYIYIHVSNCHYRCANLLDLERERLAIKKDILRARKKIVYTAHTPSAKKDIKGINNKKCVCVCATRLFKQREKVKKCFILARVKLWK